MRIEDIMDVQMYEKSRIEPLWERGFAVGAFVGLACLLLAGVTL